MVYISFREARAIFCDPKTGSTNTATFAEELKT